VNVSRRELAELDYVDIVGLVLEETGLAPELLQIEISDSLLTAASPGLEATLEALDRMGVTVVADDFDVGASSLGRLKRCHMRILKIDSTFVRDLRTHPDEAALLEAIVSLAHRMDMRVAAEGVEHEDMARLLRDCGCDAIQGNVYSRPLSALEMSRLLEQFRGALA
jgi:EAL domain-containing protein (putative c-di-GMP-specific phosphodiesterase class I)